MDKYSRLRGIRARRESPTISLQAEGRLALNKERDAYGPILSPGSGHSPNGFEKLTGSPSANPYRFNPPAGPMGSYCVRSRSWFGRTIVWREVRVCVVLSGSGFSGRSLPRADPDASFEAASRDGLGRLASHLIAWNGKWAIESVL